MYNLASKILSLFLDPLALAIILLVCAFLVRKRRPRVFEITFVVSVVFLLLAGCPKVENWLTTSLERQYPDIGADSCPSAQAIVVLGGAIRMPSMVHHASGIIDSSDRLLMALRLYHAGKAPVVVLSGGNNPLSLEETPEVSESEVMRRLLVEWGIPDPAIQVEGESINTRENALFSHRLLAPQRVGRIILVTSAMHMPRAAAAFRKAGFDVVAAPADFQAGWRAPSAIFRWMPQADAFVNSTKAMHEWLGLWVYRLRGWA
jgi:uncharacterized SAM-binding protein YcdF (DUF218 family)